jgi:Haloacid dehalogenase-like hydrolase
LLVTLTNSSQVAVDTQIKNAELMEMFEVRLSIEEVQLFKPHRHVYKWAARKMGLLPEECMLVAAHGGLARCFSFPARRSALSTGTRTGNRGTESDRSGKTPHRAGEMT